MKSKHYSKFLTVFIASLVLFSLAVGPVLAAEGTQDNTESKIPTTADLNSSPVMFIENVGQFDADARYQVSGNDSTIWLGEDALWVSVVQPSTANNWNGGVLPSDLTNKANREIVREGINIRLSFVGANLHPLLEPINHLDTHVSYFIGNGPEKWRSDVPVWGGVRYKNLYPGIDLEITSKNGHLLQQLVARADADLDAVQLRVDGVDSMALDGDHLRLTTAVGEYTLPLLQLSGAASEKLLVPTLVGNQVTSPFTNPQSDAKIVNPQSDMSDLLFSTFLGGSGIDGASGIAIDSSGVAYITGGTNSPDFPTTPGAFDTSSNGYSSIFVVKLNAVGSALTYATFLGGSGIDGASGIAIDSSGAAYITGETSSPDFPTTPGAFDTNYNNSNGYNAFVVKLNADGSALTYATFLSGSSNDFGAAIAINTSGAAYITGQTHSDNFPTTPGAFDTNFHTSFNGNDAFVVKLNADGSTLIYATFLGGSGNYDEAYGIAVSANDSAYIIGRTNSSDFPTVLGAFDTSFNGNEDAYIVKLNPDGSALTYATFLGGSGSDYARGIAIDSSGVAYITGGTNSPDFPTTPGAFDTSFNGNYSSAFVVKLNADGSALTYATFLKGSNYDFASAIAIDASGAAYITGGTSSSDFPTTPGTFNSSLNGGSDAFVVKFNTNGSALVYSTFLGGSASNEQGNAIAIDSFGAAYITGETASDDFPITSGAFDTSFASNNDAFAAKLTMGGINNIPYTVLVRDENGNPVTNAQVFRNGSLAGITDGDGALSIPGLATGDQLVARLQIHEESSHKNNHNQDSSQNWAYRIYITSLDIPKDGDPSPSVVTDPSLTQILTIRKSNTLIGFNIVVSVEWDANSVYLNELQQGFQSASDYLYDASDGQMLFEHVTIEDNNQNMGDADYQVFASNQIRPQADVGGILSNSDLHVYLGRYFDGQSSNRGSWTASNGFRTQIHEFGHYGLELYDSYFYYGPLGNKIDSDCTSSSIRTNQTSDVNATLMDWQYNASEFSMQGVSELWSNQCQNTEQWKNNGQSDWETIARIYPDANNPPRWKLKTPADSGGVIAGPNVQPVSGWSSMEIGSDADSGVCEPSLTYQFNYFMNISAAGVNVELHKEDQKLVQGVTDFNGNISVLGASAGDELIATASLWENTLWQKSIQVECDSSAAPFLANTQPNVIVLEPAPFVLQISTMPDTVANRVQIIVKSSAGLNSAPEVYLTQNSSNAILVPLGYDAVLQAYTGIATLNSTLSPSGNLIAKATNMAGQVAVAATQFALESITSGQSTTVTSSDGQAELYLPADSLSADGRVSIFAENAAGALPDNLILLSGPYTIQGNEGLTLVHNANLSMNYLDTIGYLSQLDVSTAQIYRWDGLSWQGLSSTSSETQQMVSAAINTFGTYALLVSDTIAPSTASIGLVHSNPTNLAYVDFTVAFSEPVTNVDAADFSLSTTGITGAVITAVSGSDMVYTVTVSTGNGSGSLRLNIPNTATINDPAGNSLSALPYTGGLTYAIRPQTFADVSTSFWAWQFIERLYNVGATGGCSTNPLLYCPNMMVTRGQMAVFLLRTKYGLTYTPPAATGAVFGDVPASYWAARWIEQLAAEGITGGCGNGNYCPDVAVTRGQMAVFLLRTKHGNVYTPPAATGVFGDVPTNYWAAPWIEQLAVEGITGGCGNQNYCPNTAVTRAQMAVFLVKAFNLP